MYKTGRENLIMKWRSLNPGHEIINFLRLSQGQPAATIKLVVLGQPLTRPARPETSFIYN